MVAAGTKEVVLVAQDTIRYGADLGIKHGLPNLLEMIVEQIPDLPWLRMLYIYPSPLTLRMVDVMAQHDALLPYLDMPLQHADPTVLRSMNRPSDPVMTRRLIDTRALHSDRPGDADDLHRRLSGRNRRAVPDAAALRATRWSSTTSASSPIRPSPERRRPRWTPVPPELAELRRDADHGDPADDLAQKESSRSSGSRLEILIEAVGEAEDELGGKEPISVGRARRHAPEVDGLVLVPGAMGSAR